MKKEKPMFIKITNEGARVGSAMFASALIDLLVFHNQNPDNKTILEYRNALIASLEKSIGWLERENDGTCDKTKLKKAIKDAKEAIQWTKKTWKKE